MDLCYQTTEEGKECLHRDVFMFIAVCAVIISWIIIYDLNPINSYISLFSFND